MLARSALVRRKPVIPFRRGHIFGIQPPGTPSTSSDATSRQLRQEVLALFRNGLILALAVAGLLVIGMDAPQAQPANGGQAGDFFDRLDANADGRIDADEFKGPDEAFERMDRNGDGAITRDELGGGQAGAGPGQGNAQAGRRGTMDPAQRWRQMLQRDDANGDGRISSEEFSGPEKVLRFIDENNDNVITENEVLKAANRRGGPAQNTQQRWQQLLDNCDANDDGKISAEEWPRNPEMFARLDVDGDGFIAENDLDQLRQRAPQRPDPAQLFIGLMDKNGDGQVSRQEWSNFFDAADVNADGMMSHPELLEQLKNALRPEPEQGPAEAPPAPEEGF
jgi:Ca2+-binding EF-hand superfamily protein